MRFCGNGPVSSVWLQRAYFWVALATVLLSVPANALNPDRKISQYSHAAWRLQDGFLGSAAWAIAQTTDGYIWVGTWSGIERFDGVQFVRWIPPGGEKLRFAFTTELLGTSDGSLWIGASGAGVWRWKNQQLTQYLSGEFSHVTAIVEGENGSVWVALVKGRDHSGAVCEVGSGQAHCYGESDGLPHACCQSMARDSTGYLWITGSYEAIKWKAQAMAQEIFKTPRPVLNAENLDSISVASDHSAWIGSYNHGKGAGLQHLYRGAWSPLKTAGWDSSSVGIRALLLDRHKVLWVGTVYQGLYRIRDGQVDHFGSQDGLSGDFVDNLFEDHEGNVWVATSKGIDCFKDLAVATFSPREGLSTAEVDSVLASRDGTLWVGGDQGLDAIHEGKVASLKTGKGLPGVQVTSLFEDQKGRLLVGVDSTLSILKNGKFTLIKRPNGESVGFVVGMGGDAEDNIWAEISGSPRELVQISQLKVKQVFPAPQMPAARKVAIDPEGSIWLGLISGDLARYRQGKLETFHFPHSTESYVNEVSVSRDGSVLGATGSGVIGWREGKQQMLTMQNGLPCDGVNTFVKDNHDALWLYMECGLVQISEQELQRWWGDPSIRLSTHIFDSLDGVQPGLAPFQGAARSLDGKLWFANESVLQMIDPGRLTTNSIPPPVHVEDVTADQRAFSITTDLRLPALTRDIAIRYTALSFVAPQRVHFRYMLEGQDQTWQEAGTRREAFYTNLAPRSYRFRVIACNNDGLWNETGDSFSFTIEPAYYQTTWFAFLCVAAVVGMLWLLYILRLRQAKEHIEQRLGARLEEREQIARELHDTLLQGFQGLMLRFQSVLKMLPANEPVHKAMESVLERADEVLLEGRQSVQGIRKDGADSAALEQALTECGHELSENYTPVFTMTVVGIPQALGPVIFNEVYRIAREALFNAFQHASATKIEAELTYGGEAVVLTIRDDGIGINPEFLSSGREGHWGLSGMRERAKKIGATLKVWTKPGSGTEIELTIPAKVLSPFAHRQHFWRRILGAR